MVVEAVIFLFSCKVLANRVNGLDYDSSICSSERLMFGFFFRGGGMNSRKASRLNYSNQLMTRTEVMKRNDPNQSGEKYVGPSR